MNSVDVLEEFRAAGAFLEGHFILSSGRHSPVFFQKALVFMDPVRTERLCRALAARITETFGSVGMVISPAVGGVIPGYETARALGAKAMFVEREEGRFRLRRGFALKPGQRYVLVEDILTTGLSARECLDALAGEPGVCVGAACLVDRSGGGAVLPVPLVSLLQYAAPSYAPDEVPPALAALAAVKPGSRGLAQ